MIRFHIETKRPRQMLSITDRVNEAIEQRGVDSGICLVFCPHTTAAITVNESYDPDVAQDLLLALDKAYPDRPEFRHAEGNSAAHAMATAVGCGVTLPIQNGKLALGRWQGLWFCEFDGPRGRSYTVQIIEGGR